MAFVDCLQAGIGLEWDARLATAEKDPISGRPDNVYRLWPGETLGLRGK